MAAKDRVPSLLYTPCSRQFRLYKEGMEWVMDKHFKISRILRLELEVKRNHPISRVRLCAGLTLTQSRVLGRQALGKGELSATQISVVYLPRNILYGFVAVYIFMRRPISLYYFFFILISPLNFLLILWH